MKVTTITIHAIIIVFLCSVAWAVTHQDCEKNQPQTLVCSSNTISDAGLNWSTCIKTQRSENNIIFPDKQEKWNCDGVEIEFHKTKCNYSPSNATVDYRFCA